MKFLDRADAGRVADQIADHGEAGGDAEPHPQILSRRLSNLEADRDAAARQCQNHRLPVIKMRQLASEAGIQVRLSSYTLPVLEASSSTRPTPASAIS
jgi:hypothetical protein